MELINIQVHLLSHDSYNPLYGIFYVWLYILTSHLTRRDKFALHRIHTCFTHSQLYMAVIQFVTFSELLSLVLKLSMHPVMKDAYKT